MRNQDERKFTNDYDFDLYVLRNPPQDELIDRFTRLPALPRDRISFFIESSGDTGKSWLMEFIYSCCKHTAHRPLIITLCMRDFKGKNINAKPIEKLFLPIVRQFSEDISQMYPDIAKQLPPRPPDQPSAIIHYLGFIGDYIAQLPEPVLILILIDGAEEFIDFSTDILRKIEDNIIAPLFKHNNVRVIATRRTDKISWKTSLLKRYTKRFHLSRLIKKSPTRENSSLEQMKLRIHGSDEQYFDQICQGFHYYAFDHPGINTLIYNYITDPNKTSMAMFLEKCFRKVTETPAGDPLSTEQRKILEEILLLKPPPKELITEAYKIELLDITNLFGVTASLQFLDHIQSIGIGRFEHPYFIFNAEVVAIFWELQSQAGTQVP